MSSTIMNKAAVPLLIQRIAVTLFMGIWALDKFVNPGHTAGVFTKFYGISLPMEMTWVLGLVQLAVLIAFLVGFMKTYSYFLVFLMHAGSTLSAWKVYLALYDGNLLFWAAIPVLAALWLQFSLRDFDSISLDNKLRAGALPS
ncbi:hypothetical protein JCM17844_09390 [Iodidimonas gelatinilytica]|nr:hypothetical protein [Iodidimonas gelatinilytica]GEQ97302.1 hypothetical protein JCM17844_09390 [Iodidimonas gelatinilytica]